MITTSVVRLLLLHFFGIYASDERMLTAKIIFFK